VCLASAVAQAQPVSIVALGGLTLTPTTTFSNNSHHPTVAAMAGPAFQAGFEVGNYFNNQFTFVYTNLSGTATYDNPAGTADVGGEVFAGGYQLTIDVLGKDDFSPYFGGGGAVGSVNIYYSGTNHGVTVLKNEQDLFAELHLVGGLRYTAPFGLGLRAEVSFSAFGPFIGTWVPEFGLTWRL
jgi:hypothetical protein